MRLLNVETFKLETFLTKPVSGYVVLSHTWGQVGEEVSFHDVENGQLGKAGTGPTKLKGCCRQARRDGYRYVWIDTCCIDAKNLMEQQEAIHSMFEWYREASICYAYLADVPVGDDPRDSGSKFHSSRWFERGWTLQELLAPRKLRFYDSQWNLLGTKGDLCDIVEKVTGIPHQFLQGTAELGAASVAQRMSWAAKRQTTKEEDVAYCLVGIFGVVMPMIYGERARAAN